MRFAPSREQLDFAASVRALLADADTPSVARAWAADDPGPGRELWTRLAEQGVLDLGRPDSGATAVDLVLGFEELGRAAVPGPYVESVAALPAALTTATAQPEDAMATLAMPPNVPYALDAAAADDVYVVAADGVHRAVVGDPVASVDAVRRLADVRPGERIADADIGSGFDHGALATAAQLQGLGDAVLEMTTAYAKQRRQFGTEIGSFQAVKHQLADAVAGLALARPLLFGAALALGTSTTARDVSAAKVACADAAYRASRVALQVHGAIGYTAEYDLALWLTKIRALRSAWGTPSFHRGRLLEALQ